MEMGLKSEAVISLQNDGEQNQDSYSECLGQRDFKERKGKTWGEMNTEEER